MRWFNCKKNYVLLSKLLSVDSKIEQWTNYTYQNGVLPFDKKKLYLIAKNYFFRVIETEEEKNYKLTTIIFSVQAALKGNFRWERKI